MIRLKTKNEIESLRHSGAILARLLDLLKRNARVGISTKELDDIARAFISENNARAAFLGYRPEGAHKPYPAAICASVNNVVVHGTPDSYSLKEGDLLKIDTGVVFEDMITDAAITVGIGRISKSARHLMDATYMALQDAIKTVKIGSCVGDIGYAVARRAKKEGFYVLKELTGHGVGYELHEDPVIFNFGHKGEGAILREGAVIAIEPMFSTTSEFVVQNKDESYSAYGGGLTAHFEHTIAITKKGAEILTQLNE